MPAGNLQDASASVLQGIFCLLKSSVKPSMLATPFLVTGAPTYCRLRIIFTSQAGFVARRDHVHNVFWAAASARGIVIVQN